jgi:hypothetical protein
MNLILKRFPKKDNSKGQPDFKSSVFTLCGTNKVISAWLVNDRDKKKMLSIRIDDGYNQ